MQTNAFLLLVLSGFTAALPGRAAPLELFVLWQGQGPWQCTLTVQNGAIDRAEPYMFLDARDRIQRSDPATVVSSTHSRGHAAGLHLFLSGEAKTAIRLATNRGAAEITLADVPADDARIVKVRDAGVLLFGRGNPALGPQHAYRTNLPVTFVPPKPSHPVALPADWAARAPLRIRLSAMPATEVRIRRVAHEASGLLFLEVHSPAGPLRGRADVSLGGRSLGLMAVEGSLWLSLEPRIGRLAVAVETPAGTQNLNVPTTLVEVRGNRIFLNGDPFLIKGTLPGDLTADDAEFIRTLGMNTLRGGDVLKYAERHGFMAIASIQGRKLEKLSNYQGAAGRAQLKKDLSLNLAAEAENGRVAADSPFTLIAQLDNERTTIGANPLEPDVGNVGADPWSDFLRGEAGDFVRLNRILAETWNVVKPMAPTLPLGYANESQGYIAPAFLDVYLHNSYLPRDRYGISLKEYSRWQGGERRPFVNTEYGANRFTPESYHGAKNSPLLEKLQAWGYRQIWNTFMAAGSAGGTAYKLYDSTSAADQGTKNFGIMTVDRQPKLACWELWHLWRDFEVAPAAGDAGARAVSVLLRRDYAARGCRLSLQHDGQEWSADLGDIAPNSRRTVALPFPVKPFHWRVEYSTHRGLPAVAVGAWPVALEEADFARRLEQREAPDFLRQLLTARVLTVEGREAPSALVDMTTADGVIPLAFACADGTTYVTALSRRRARDTHYVKADLVTSFAGDVVQVDEWTGKPLAIAVSHEATASGIVFRNVAVPLIPGPIGARSNEPLSLPVFRITRR